MSDLDADTPHSCSASGHQTTKSGKDFRQGIYICNHNPGARRWCAFQRIPTAIKIKLAQKKKTFPLWFHCIPSYLLHLHRRHLFGCLTFYLVYARRQMCSTFLPRSFYVCRAFFATIAIIKRNILLRAKLRRVSTKHKRVCMNYASHTIAWGWGVVYAFRITASCQIRVCFVLHAACMKL